MKKIFLPFFSLVVLTLGMMTQRASAIYCGNDPINNVDVLGLAKVAVDEKNNLTGFGKAIVGIAKDDPAAARSLLLAAQVNREITGANVEGKLGNGDAGSVSNVLRAIDTAVGVARHDGREEWKYITANVRGVSRNFDDGPATQRLWVDSEFARYAPAIAANAKNAAAFSAAQRAASAKDTALLNSPGYKLKEIGLETTYIPARFAVGVFNAVALPRVTTGQEVVFNGWTSRPGLNEVPTSSRYSEAALTLVPMLKLEGTAVEGFAKTGKGLFGSAPFRINPTGANMNCVNCAITLDRRLGGSLASAMYGSPAGLEEITGVLGGSFGEVSGMMEIGSILSKSGNGARGIVAGANSIDDIGHVWNVINDNGVIRFLDGQTGEVPERVLGNFDMFDELQFLLTFPGK